MTTLTRKQKSDIFNIEHNRMYKNDDDNFTSLHNVIASIRGYLIYQDILILNETQTMFDNKTRVHIFELPKQAIILSCHGAGMPDDIFNMYDLTIQIVSL